MGERLRGAPERRACAIALLCVALLPSGCVLYQGVEPPPDPATLPLGAPLCRSETHTYEYRVNGEHKPDLTRRTAKAAPTGTAIEGTRIVGQRAPKDRVLEIAVVNSEQSSQALAILTGLTMFLFPLWGENTVTVSGRIVDDGRVLATAETRASVKAIFHLFLLFALPFNDYSIVPETVTALTRKVCADLAAQVTGPAPK